MVQAGSGGVSPLLKWVDKRIITNRQCSQTFGSRVIIPSTMCGIGWEYDGQSTCNGDSGILSYLLEIKLFSDTQIHSPKKNLTNFQPLPTGGPLVIDEGGIWTQIGIVSFVSNRGCSSGDPSGYVRTTSFLNWISIHTGIPIRS